MSAILFERGVGFEGEAGQNFSEENTAAHTGHDDHSVVATEANARFYRPKPLENRSRVNADSPTDVLSVSEKFAESIFQHLPDGFMIIGIICVGCYSSVGVVSFDGRGIVESQHYDGLCPREEEGRVASEVRIIIHIVHAGIPAGIYPRLKEVPFFIGYFLSCGKTDSGSTAFKENGSYLLFSSQGTVC